MRSFLAALAAVAAWAQIPQLPRADVLDFYGLRSVSESLVMQASGIRPGTPLPPSKADVEERINQIDRVAGSRLEAVCCFEGKTVLYIGIEERDAPHYETRPAPGGVTVLPEGVITAYRAYQDTLRRNPSAQAPAAFSTLTAQNLTVIRTVLRESADELHRTAAADLLFHALQKAQIVDDLQYALTDADPGVRAAAIRSLQKLALLGRENPATRIRVPLGPFINLLHSLAWSDRMEASRALEAITAEGDPAALAQLRMRALDELVEMARWKTPEHARPAFRLVGRIGGLTPRAIEQAWSTGDRDSVIAAARRRVR